MSNSLNIKGGVKAGADVNMNSFKLTGLAVPSTAGDSLRATAKLTEANLEDAVDKKHVLGDLTPDISTQNLLRNGSFEHWLGGTTTNPDNWGLASDGGSPTVARENSSFKVGFYSAKITTDANNTTLDQLDFVDGLGLGLESIKSKFFTFDAWVLTSTANFAKISIIDGVSQYDSSYHTGNGEWQRLRVTAQINAGATTIGARIHCVGTGVAYIDDAALYAGNVSFAFNHNHEDLHKKSLISAYTTLEVQSNDTYKILPLTDILLDTANEIDLVSGTVKIKKAGVYSLVANFTWQSSNAGARRTSIWDETLSQSIMEDVRDGNTSAFGVYRYGFSTLIKLNANTEISLKAWQDSGGDLIMYGCYLNVWRIAEV